MPAMAELRLLRTLQPNQRSQARTDLEPKGVGNEFA